MTRQQCKNIQVAALAALASLEAKFGIKVSCKHGSFGDTHCELKFQFAEINEAGQVETAEASHFKFMAEYSGGKLKPEDLGRSFQSRGYTYTITGWNRRKCKRPILAKREDGAGFKFTVDYVAAVLPKVVDRF
jgi:hypothetical protein